MLTHPTNGRLKNGLTKSKKNSLVHVTEFLFFLEKQLYCELLEFQFISTRTDTDGGITIPWKTAENKTNGKSVIEQRTAQIRQERSTKSAISAKLSSPLQTMETLLRRILI